MAPPDRPLLLSPLLDAPADEEGVPDDAPEVVEAEFVVAGVELEAPVVVEVNDWRAASAIVYEAWDGLEATSDLYVSFIIVAFSDATGFPRVEEAQQMLICPYA
jgi:hypothetical protein